MHIAKKIGIGITFSWFFFGGLAHFVLTDFFVSIVPPWVPWPLAAVYVSGVLEVMGALAVLIPAYRAMAGMGLILLTLAVTPANVHMWLHPELFPKFSESALTVRLLIQVALLGCIGWSTQKWGSRLTQS